MHFRLTGPFSKSLRERLILKRAREVKRQFLVSGNSFEAVWVSRSSLEAVWSSLQRSLVWSSFEAMWPSLQCGLVEVV